MQAYKIAGLSPDSCIEVAMFALLTTSTYVRKLESATHRPASRISVKGVPIAT